jgi:hypothetical protein
MKYFYSFSLPVLLLASCAHMSVPPNAAQAPAALQAAPEAQTPAVTQAPATATAAAPVTAPATTEALATPAQPPAKAPQDEKKEEPKKKDGLAFGGNLLLAIENWSHVGADSDSKIGFGLGGTIGIGYQFGDMKILVGPDLWYNRWTQNYSNKSQSATSSVYVALSDAGVALTTYFDDFFLALGTGSANISSGMTVNGKEIAYAYDGTSYNYTTVSLGMKMNAFLLGLTFRNYSDLASNANHVGIMFGLGF